MYCQFCHNIRMTVLGFPLGVWVKAHLISHACFGFTQCHNDKCVFQKKATVNTPNGPREETIIVGIYVDDQFVISTHTDEHSLYQAFTTALQASWEVEDEGEVQDLLNVEIHRDGNTMARM